MNAVEGRTPRFYVRDADAARMATAIRQRRADRDVAARIDPGVALARRLTAEYPVVSNPEVEVETVVGRVSTWPAPTGEPERITFEQWAAMAR